MSAPVILPGIFNEVKTPWRFYDNKFKRNKYRKACKNEEGTCGYALNCPSNQLLPFQIIRDYTNSTVTELRLYQVNPDGTTVLVYTFTNPGFVFNYQVEEKEYLQYDGSSIGQLISQGMYEAELEDADGNIWYSEPIEIMCEDKSEQLVINGDFTENGNAWDIVNDGDAPITYVGGQVCVNNTGSSDVVRFSQSGVFEPGKLYLVVTNCTAYTPIIPVFISCGDDGGTQIAVTSTGIKSTIVTGAGGTDSDILRMIYPGNANACFDYIHIYEIIPGNVNCNIKLEWWNDCGYVGNLFYNQGFINQFFCSSVVEIGQSDYKLVSEAHENGQKKAIDHFIRRDTTYSLALGLVPRYVLDAIFEMPLHTWMKITLPNSMGGGEAFMDAVNVTYQWEEIGDGCLVNCALIFSLDDSSEKEGCCQDELPDPCTGSNLPQLIATTNAPVCRGDTIGFAASNIAPGQESSSTFEWTGPSGFTSTSPNPSIGGADPLANSGTYTVTVTNQFGCQESMDLVVTVNEQPVLTVIDKHSPGGENDGYITVQGSVGPAPYIYTDGVTVLAGSGAVTFSGLAAGTYTIDVYDDNGCTTQIMVTI